MASARLASVQLADARLDAVPRGHCPVCKTANATALFKVNAREAAQHFVTLAQDPARHHQLAAHIETLWHSPTCSVMRCAACEFCFADPYVGGDATFYGLAYQGNAYPSGKWEFQRVRALLAGLVGKDLPQQPRLLEIGAGHGLFIRLVSPSLVRPQDIVCLEYSTEGIRRIREAGVEAQSIDVRDYSPAKPFDVVCAFQVLEHLDRLDLLFEKLNALTNTSAHLFLSVPNALRIEFYERSGALLDMPPNHIGRWNREAIDRISERHGWQVQNFERQPNPPVAFAKQFAIYRYMRSRQLGGPLHRMVDRITIRPLQRLLQLPLVGWQFLCALGYVRELVRADLGDAVFMHLRKNAQPISQPATQS